MKIGHQVSEQSLIDCNLMKNGISHIPPLFGESDIYVFEEGVLMSDTLWQYDPSENKITFDTIPLGDTLIEIAYEY